MNLMAIYSARLNNNLQVRSSGAASSPRFITRAVV
jgi:hypothetical protein